MPTATGSAAPPPSTRKRIVKIFTDDDNMRRIRLDSGAGNPSFQELRRIATQLFFPGKDGKVAEDLVLRYKDEDDDLILIGSGGELEEAFRDAQAQKRSLKIQISVRRQPRENDNSVEDLEEDISSGSTGDEPHPDENMKPVLEAVSELIKDDKAMAELKKAFPELAERIGKGEGVRTSLDRVLSTYPKLRSHRFVEKTVSSLWAVSAAIEMVVPPQKVGAVLLDIWFDFQPLVQSGRICCHSPMYLLRKGIGAARRAVSCRKGDCKKGLSESDRGNHGGSAMCPIAAMIGNTFLATMFSDNPDVENTLDAIKMKKMIKDMKIQDHGNSA